MHGSVKEAAAEVQSLSGGTKGLCGHSWHCRRPVALEATAEPFGGTGGSLGNV